jgi:hypothetical protein
MPVVRPLLAELCPDTKYKRMPQAKVHLAKRLEVLYNERPMYHLGKRKDFRFSAYSKLNQELMTAWDEEFGSSAGSSTAAPETERTDGEPSKKARPLAREDFLVD